MITEKEYTKEIQLKPPVLRYLTEQKFTVYDEVRLNTRNIDLIGKKNSEVVSIELKLKDWPRAIAQAYLNLRVSNYSYVALPEQAWSRIDRRIYTQAFEYGIGLLSVDGVTRQIMHPVRSKRIQPNLRKRFLESLKGVTPC
jgi:hypothetical protein